MTVEALAQALEIEPGFTQAHLELGRDGAIAPEEARQQFAQVQVAFVQRIQKAIAATGRRFGIVISTSPDDRGERAFARERHAVAGAALRAYAKLVHARTVGDKFGGVTTGLRGLERKRRSRALGPRQFGPDGALERRTWVDQGDGELPKPSGEIGGQLLGDSVEVTAARVDGGMLRIAELLVSVPGTDSDGA